MNIYVDLDEVFSKIKARRESFLSSLRGQGQKGSCLEVTGQNSCHSSRVLGRLSRLLSGGNAFVDPIGPF